MSREVLHNTLREVDRIGCLTITGGEPSLAIDVLEELVTSLRWRRMSFDYFYIVTNGKTVRNWKKFLAVMDELHEWADSKEACSMTVSQDQYHREVHDLNLGKFRNEYGEERPYMDLKDRRNPIIAPLAEGRAANGLGWTEPEQQTPWQVEDEAELCVYEGDVYVSANGNVVSNCNMSFNRIDKESKGNVLNTSLSEIIRGYSVPMPLSAVG
jgi:organic radical activating enzyme